MEKEQLELFILQTLQRANNLGGRWVRQRILELEGPTLFHSGGVGLVTREPYLERPAYLAKVTKIGDAVVRGAGHIGRFTSARNILDTVRSFPTIAAESDERMKRRKVSQALYTQKGNTMVSVKVGAYTVWGLKHWLDETGAIRAEFEPQIQDLNDESGSGN